MSFTLTHRIFRFEAKRQKWDEDGVETFYRSIFLVITRRISCSTILQCCSSDHSDSKWKHHQSCPNRCEYFEHALFRCEWRCFPSFIALFVLQYWFVFPTQSIDEDDEDRAELEPWLWWNKISQLLDYHSKVYPVLGNERPIDPMRTEENRSNDFCRTFGRCSQWKSSTTLVGRTDSSSDSSNKDFHDECQRFSGSFSRTSTIHH